MFFSWSSAMRETKRLRSAGIKADMVKKWYGWVIRFPAEEKTTPPDGFEPVEVKEMEFKNGKMTLSLAHPQLAAFAEAVADFFNDALGVNYVATSFWREDLGPMELVVQRKDGKTPAQLHQELLMAVENKFPGESRHETALRYIIEHENRDSGCAQATDESI